MNKFQQMESLGRERFNELLKDINVPVGKILYTTGRFDRYDAYSDTHIYEIKYRDETIGQYDTLFLEKDKAEALFKEAKESNRKAVYVNILNNEMYLYDLTLLEKHLHFFETTKIMNKATAASRFNKVEKLIYDLPKDIAVKYYRNEYTDYKFVEKKNNALI